MRSHPIGFLLIIIGSALQLARLNADLWNDEIYTLQHFVFVPLSVTITDYHVPNNHIFFNIINNVYVHLFDIHNLDELLETPYELRIICLIYSGITMLYVYKIGSKFFNNNTAILALIILITTIPYYNFTTELRGYGISMMLFTIIIYNCLKFQLHSQQKRLLFICIFTLMLLYTTPSNFLVIVPVVLYFLILVFYSIVQQISHKKPINFQLISKNPFMKILFSIGIGIAVCLLIYALNWQKIFYNEYVNYKNNYTVNEATEFVKHVLQSVISGRFIYYVILLIGVIIMFSPKYKQKINKHILLFILIVITPFIIIFINKDPAPYRVLSVWVPISALIIAYFTETLIAYLFAKQLFINVFLLLFAGYSFYCFYHEQNKIKLQLYTNILEGESRPQDFYSLYYHYHYYPNSAVKNFASLHYDNVHPIVIKFCEPHDIPYYLQKHKLPYFTEDKLDSILLENDSVFIVTSHPMWFNKDSSRNYYPLYDKANYHSFILSTRK